MNEQKNKKPAEGVPLGRVGAKKQELYILTTKTVLYVKNLVEKSCTAFSLLFNYNWSLKLDKMIQPSDWRMSLKRIHG